MSFGYYKDINHPDPYSLLVSIASYLGTPHTIILTGQERFELVSSLYGPGNLVCWFLLLLSVLVTWTLHPRAARRDTITPDLLAVLTVPLVAAAHLLHQLHAHAQAHPRGRDLFTASDRDGVRSVAAIEAPLAVCEAFVACASLLYCVAAWRGHSRRMALVLAVGALCFAAEVPLWMYALEYGPRGSSLVRPYVVQAGVLFGMLTVWYGLMLGVYLVEMAWGVAAAGGRAAGGGVVGAVGRVLWPGRVSRWMAAVSGVAVAGASVWIKYGGMYPAEWRFHAFRFVPKSVARMGDLDQVVAMLGGLVTLGFSGWDAYRGRRTVGQRDEEVEGIVLRVLGRQGGDGEGGWGEPERPRGP